MLLAAIAEVATELRAAVKDKIDRQKVVEIGKNAVGVDVKKFTRCLTGDEGFKCAVEFEACLY